MNNQQTLNFAIKIAKEAGDLLLKHFETDLRIDTKSNISDLVSKADLESEAYIINAIKSEYPNHNILAEETGEHSQESDYTWIIDPLDGTTNFLHGLPIFAVNIALKYSNEIILGVTHAPKMNETFHASKDCGAYLNNEKISVSETSNPKDALLVTGFPYVRKGEKFEKAVKMFINGMKTANAVRRLGAASLDMCYTACGRMDGFFELNLKPWDIAAGVCLINEAGGKVTNVDGSPIDIHAQNLIASNGLIHDNLVKQLNL